MTFDHDVPPPPRLSTAHWEPVVSLTACRVLRRPHPEARLLKRSAIGGPGGDRTRVTKIISIEYYVCSLAHQTSVTNQRVLLSGGPTAVTPTLPSRCKTRFTRYCDAYRDPRKLSLFRAASTLTHAARRRAGVPSILSLACFFDRLFTWPADQPRHAFNLFPPCSKPFRAHRFSER